MQAKNICEKGINTFTRHYTYTPMYNHINIQVHTCIILDGKNKCKVVFPTWQMVRAFELISDISALKDF